jgi:hypothetical protein
LTTPHSSAPSAPGDGDGLGMEGFLKAGEICMGKARVS